MVHGYVDGYPGTHDWIAFSQYPVLFVERYKAEDIETWLATATMLDPTYTQFVQDPHEWNYASARDSSRHFISHIAYSYTADILNLRANIKILYDPLKI